MSVNIDVFCFIILAIIICSIIYFTNPEDTNKKLSSRFLRKCPKCGHEYFDAILAMNENFIANTNAMNAKI